MTGSVGKLRVSDLQPTARSIPMINLGTKNRLRISRVGAYDIYLDGGESGEVLLLDGGKGDSVTGTLTDTDGYAEGKELEVFVYLDVDDTLMATTTIPRVSAGECACMSVVALTNNGAFLDWGLRSDLFVPRSEQLGEMSVGSRCVAYAMLDKTSDRMIASTRLYKYLQDENHGAFKPKQRVDLLVCQKTDLGYKAVVNGTHLGVLYKNEVFTDLDIGDSCDGYIKALREDNKIDLILQTPSVSARSEIETKILNHLKKHGGESAITDKSPPEIIYKTFGISKKAYKSAIGGLYRNRLILLSKEKISLVK